jgi:hypothetical protein
MRVRLVRTHAPGSTTRLFIIWLSAAVPWGPARDVRRKREVPNPENTASSTARPVLVVSLTPIFNGGLSEIELDYQMAANPTDSIHHESFTCPTILGA